MSKTSLNDGPRADYAGVTSILMRAASQEHIALGGYKNGQQFLAEQVLSRMKTIASTPGVNVGFTGAGIGVVGAATESTKTVSPSSSPKPIAPQGARSVKTIKHDR